MAPPSAPSSLVLCLFISVSLLSFTYASAEEFLCEQLPVENCAFAVSMTGERCVLETNILKDGTVQLECQTSAIVTDKFRSWIEDTECIEGCGLNRMSIGLSSDFLGEHELQQSICSPSCFHSCPNIVELYTKLASGEGVGLQTLCEAQNVAPRKLIQDSIPIVTPRTVVVPTSNVAQSPKSP